MCLMWPPNSDHNFGLAPPNMESMAALASSIVAYLPNSLYRAFWVEGQLAAGHDPALLGRIVEHEVKPLGLRQDGLRGEED